MKELDLKTGSVPEDEIDRTLLMLRNCERMKDVLRHAEKVKRVMGLLPPKRNLTKNVES